MSGEAEAGIMVCMEAPAGYKICPECAEPVREAARKCRFCGYRFEGEVGQAQPSVAAQPSVEAPPSVETPSVETPSVETPSVETPSVETPPSVEALLTNWGVELEDDERPAIFTSARAHIDDASDASGSLDIEGFLLLTNRTLQLFLPQPRSLLRREDPGARRVLCRRLDSLGPARARRRLTGSRLQIGEDILLSGIPKGKLSEIEAHLQRWSS